MKYTEEYGWNALKRDPKPRFRAAGTCLEKRSPFRLPGARRDEEEKVSKADEKKNVETHPPLFAGEREKRKGTVRGCTRGLSAGAKWVGMN